jgi:hypothetical protein
METEIDMDNVSFGTELIIRLLQKKAAEDKGAEGQSPPLLRRVIKPQQLLVEEGLCNSV